jgi:S-formylglutathione hydrolase FrmB
MNSTMLKRLIIISLLIVSVLSITSTILLKTNALTFLKNMSVDQKYVSGNNTNEESHQINEFSSCRSVTDEGSKMNLKFYSKSLNMDREVQIYLPQGYSQSSILRYPVIYFLHATTQNSFSEDPLFSIFNNLMSSKTISPVIIVKPDGSCPPWEGSYFTNSSLYGNFEDYIVYDLIEFIDSTFNTIASRDKRAIMGWSAGGNCAMESALKHPDIYCGVVSHSGRLNMWMHSLYVPFILSENGGSPVSAFRPDAGPLSYGAFTMAGAFSPNPENPPYYVDFPFDSLGNWIDSVWKRWLLHDCVSIAHNISKEDDLAIYFDCGTYDETLAYDFNASFADSLDILGLTYKFQSYPGGHYDRFIRYPIGLAFLDSVMNRTESNF